jgi:transcriptional regulator with XRE-family HTH domain
MKDVLSFLEAKIGESGLQKKEICKRIGKSPLTLWRILSGKRRLTVEFVLEMVNAIGREPGEFFCEMLQQKTLPSPRKSRRKTGGEPVKRNRRKRSAA